MADVCVKRLPGWLMALFSILAPVAAFAGGSGLNTIVVINQASSNSLALGNYYCERRQVPPNNVLMVNWSGGNTAWTNTDFQNKLLTPLLNFVAIRQLSNQVDYVVLSMDIPFQVNYGNWVNSTTAALFYGLKPGGGTDWQGLTNSYAWSEEVFHQVPPASAPGYSFLTTMLTANTLAQAQNVVDQGAQSDGSFPRTSVILAKSSDVYRNIRHVLFDNAIFNARLRGNCYLARTNTDSLSGFGVLQGAQNGLQNFAVPPGTFAPGAIADDLTSFGGIIFGYNDQTTLFAFLAAGASGSYGTVTEPTPDLGKFPDPQDYFYQARGFSLAESYYQSIYSPYQGLIVGEPLAAPFAVRGAGAWSLSSNTVLHGTANLTAHFAAYDSVHPLSAIDFFIDGLYWRTITNAGPTPGNVLTVTLNGYPVNYRVPAGANLSAVAAGLAAQLNTAAISNITKIVASAHGDRVELRSFSTNEIGESFFFADSSSSPAPVRFYRVVYLDYPAPPQLDLLGRDPSGGMRVRAVSPPGIGFVLQASANLKDWVPIAANPGGGPLEFVDRDASVFSQRFYRLNGSVPDPRPRLSLTVNGAKPVVHVNALAGVSYGLLASTNLADWSMIFTNAQGGAADFLDSAAAQNPVRFYRATMLKPPTPQVSPVPPASANSTLLQINGALQPFVVQVSTNLSDWTPIYTNLSVGRIPTTTASAPGSATYLSTYLACSQNDFLDSTAYGRRSFTVNGIFSVGSWIQLIVTKTNGVSVTVCATNLSPTATILDLTAQLAAGVNSMPALMGSDGVIAEDVSSNFGDGAFTLRARSPGLQAAGVQAWLGGNPQLVMTPKTTLTLTANLTDLQPRNHLYVTAGLAQLAANVALDTTTLADGYHELTAVAYEGSNVRTQTRAVVPVYVQNSNLAATLTAVDFGSNAPVTGSYHIQVAANTSAIAGISLFGTGGLLASATNQSTVVFPISGPLLGAGLHPFYAIVRGTNGRQYRTPNLWLRLF